MGVASSRALADHLASACAAADSGSFKAAQLMDANFLATLTGFLADVTADEGWAELPVELTTVISTYLERRRDVTQAVVARWIDEPWTFFSLPQGDPPTQLYLSLRALSRRNLDPVDEARRRVNLVLFHNLRTEFQERFGNPRKDPLTIYLSGVAKLTDPGEVKNNCSDWSYSGGRYIALGESSGGNGGLLLRTTIPRSRLEMRMPLAMDDRMIPTYAAQIRDKAERWRCHGAADKIIEYYTSIWKGWLADLSWEPSQESLRWGSKNAPGRVRKRQKRASAPGYKGPAYGMMTPGSDVQGLGGEVSWPNRSAAYNGPLALPTGLTSSGAVTAGSREPWNGGETQSRPPLLRDAAPLVAYNSATASKSHTTERGRATLVAPTGDVRGRWAPDEGTATPMQSTEVPGIAIQTIIDYRNPASNPDKSVARALPGWYDQPTSEAVNTTLQGMHLLWEAAQAADTSYGHVDNISQYDQPKPPEPGLFEESAAASGRTLAAEFYPTSDSTPSGAESLQLATCNDWPNIMSLCWVPFRRLDPHPTPDTMQPGGPQRALSTTHKSQPLASSLRHVRF